MRRPITTGRKRVPTWHLIAISWPWAAGGYADGASNQPLVLTLSKFVSDPLIISLLTGLNILFNFLVGVFACYLSDRIWTRWGRRSPFLLAGWLGSAVCIVLIPLMPGLWSLAAVIVAYQFFCDVNRPWEPLYNEVVPTGQRGHAQMFRLLLVGAVSILLSTVMLARFDGEWELPGGFRIRGDVALYWLGAVLLVGTSVGLLLLVEETPPDRPRDAVFSTQSFPSEPDGLARSPLRAFVVDTFGSRQAWRVYLLYLCPVLSMMGGGVGTLWMLFQTKQLGLVAADLARINAWVAPVSLLVYVPVLGLLADRHGGGVRMALMRIGLIMPAVVIAAVFVLSRTGTPTTVPVLIVAGLVASFFQTMVWVVWGPLTYDYIPSDRMGTFTGGFTFVSGLAGFVLAMIAGGWVWLATRVQSPANIPTTNPGDGVSDFSAVAILAVVTSVVAVATTFWFASEERKGHVVRAS